MRPIIIPLDVLAVYTGTAILGYGAGYLDNQRGKYIGFQGVHGSLTSNGLMITGNTSSDSPAHNLIR